VTVAHSPFAERDPAVHRVSERLCECALVIRVRESKPGPYLLLLKHTWLVERLAKPHERLQYSSWFDTQLSWRMRPHGLLRLSSLPRWTAEVLVPPPREVRGPTRVCSGVVTRTGGIDRKSIE